MPAYREFYTKWSGKVYVVMLDGDIHILHYRKSHFENPELRKKFSARFQEATNEWTNIVQKLGIDSQKRQYKNFLDGARALGYKI